MTGDKFSLFGNANNASYPTPVGIQGGDNVQMPPNALARAIQDAIAQSVNFTFTGNLAAANLSGTNTGDETPATLIAKGAQIIYYGTASGTNTYAVTASPVATGYTTKLLAIVTFTNANTGAATLNLNGLGAKEIQFKGAALTGGEIFAGSTLELIYDGTQFQIVGVVGSLLNNVQGTFYGTASGTNTYAATLSAPAPAAYVTNMIYSITFTNGNTSTATLNLNSLGAKAIQQNGAALASGQIQAGATLCLIYDGTQFQIIGTAIPANAVTNLQLAQMPAHTLKVNITGSTANAGDSSLSAILDAEIGSTRGTIIERGSGGWTAVTPGTTGFVWTSNGAGADPSYQALGAVTTTWATALDLDFTAQSNQTLGSDTNFTIGGITWTKVNSANDQTAMAVVNGTGLVIAPKNNTNSYTGTTRTCPYLYTDIPTLVPGYWIDMPLRIWIFISADTNFGTVVGDAVGAAVDNLGTTNTISSFVIRRAVQTGPVKSLEIGRSTAAAPTFTANPSALDNTDRVMMLQLPIGVFQNEFGFYQGTNSSIWPLLSAMIPRQRGGSAASALSMTGTVQDVVTGLPHKFVVYGQRASVTATPPTYTIARIRIDYRVQ